MADREEEEELTGLEWEAEKAYIIATSPRNTVSFSSRSNGTELDDFSLEENTVPIRLEQQQQQQQPSVTVISVNNESVTIIPRIHIETVMEQLSEPVTSEPVTSEPVTSEPVTSEPVTSEPVTSEPVTSEPVTSEPATSESVSNVPATVATEPVTTTSNLSLSCQPTGMLTSSSSHSSTTLTIPSYTSLSLTIPHTDTLIIYGPSGLGRSTLVKKLVYHSPQQFSLVISHTTRTSRANEMYARDYYFVSRSDMMQRIKQGKFMEYVQIDKLTNTNSYTNSLSPRQSFSAFPPSSVIKATASEGDLYGTSWEAFQEAQYSGKPWIVLNVSTKGAEQLKDIGVKGHYLLMSSDNHIESDRLVPDHMISFDKPGEAFGFLENYALSLTHDTYKPTSKLGLAQEEWERVPSIQLPGKRNKTKRSTQRHLQKNVTFIELLSHFQSSNLSEQLSMIRPEATHSRISRVFGSTRMTKKLHNERNTVFAIALCKFDDHNPLHTRALSTIYQYLTGVTSPCPRFGSHWEDIGFQGSDPTDDFRGVGMLSILQLVWFLGTPHTTPIALEIFHYSKTGPNPLPFCVISINITCIVLQALREGRLSRECNRLDQVFVVCNNLYASIYVSFFHNWRRHQKGVMELGNVLQDVGAFAKKNARFMMRELESFIQERQKNFSKPLSQDITVEPSVEFSQIENM